MEFFSFIDQSHSFNFRQIDKQILPVLIILKLSYFGKKVICEKFMVVLWIFDLWDQEIDSWFMNHEPLISTLLYIKTCNKNFHKFHKTFKNFESFIPDVYKCGLLETLLRRGFRLCSNYENFHREIGTLKSILKHNSYPHNLVNHCIKNFLNKLSVQRDFNFTVPKRELICILSYLGKASLDLRTKLRQTIEKNLPFCKLQIIFGSNCRLTTLFHFKDSLEKKIHSGIIYCYGCSNCNITYYGKTFHHFYARVTEHTGGSLILQENA